MTDRFQSSADTVSSPAEDALAIVPHDTNPLGSVPKAIYVGGAGNIAMRGISGAADVTFRNLPAGSILPFRPAFVRATGTTATFILGLY